MSAIIINLNTVTKLDIPPEIILSKALDKKFGSVVVLGFLEDGSTYFASSSSDGGNILWLMECCKNNMMKIVEEFE